MRILIRCILAMTYEISASLCSKELDERDGKITIVEAQPHQILPRWFASAPLWFTVSFGCSLLNAITDKASRWVSSEFAASFRACLVFLSSGMPEFLELSQVHFQAHQVVFHNA